MIARLALALTCASCLTALVACDSAGGSGEPTTSCDYNFTAHNDTLKDFGESCTAGNQCAFGVCILPGATGNNINTQFGFCSRGCDCDNATASRLSDDEKLSFTCLYPPGSQGAKHQVAPICESVADCTAIDPGWTSCSVPTGSAKMVCQAL